MPDIGTLMKIIQEDRGTRDDGTRPQRDAAPGPVLKGRQMTRKEQVRAAAGHAARSGWRKFHAARKHDGGFLHWVFTFQGRSVQGQADYATSRAWVPPGHEGGVAEEWGVRYHRRVALPATALGQAFLGTVQSPYAFAAALLTLAAVIIPLALWLGRWLGLLAGFFTALGLVATALIPLAFLASTALIGKERPK